MKIRSVVLAAAVFALVLAPYVAMAQQPSALAELKDEAGKVVGRATFTQDLPDGGVWIELRVAGLISGVHAIHVHTVANCTAPGFLSAGGHFNPEGRKHGFLNPEGAHAGDLPNMMVPASGSARYEAASYRITLGPGPNTVFDADGSALVIHAVPDDYMTDPAGNAGARMVCGVITKP